MRLAAKDLQMSSSSSSPSYTSSVNLTNASSDNAKAEEKQLPKDSNSSLKTTSKQNQHPNWSSSGIGVEDDDFQLPSIKRKSTSVSPAKNVVASTEASIANPAMSTPNSLNGIRASSEKSESESESASPASLKKLSPAFSPRADSNSPSSILSPKSKILADIKKQRENRSREDELELDEYNPEDELDELLLKPEDILGEEFSLTSGIEGLCVDDSNAETKEVCSPKASPVKEFCSPNASPAKDNSIISSQDDDEWEDISHDDSATIDDEDQIETIDGNKRTIGGEARDRDGASNDVTRKNDKLAFLLHDECVAMVGE